MIFAIGFIMLVFMLHIFGKVRLKMAISIPLLRSCMCFFIINPTQPLISFFRFFIIGFCRSRAENLKYSNTLVQRSS